MSLRQYTSDISVYTIDTVSQLAFLKSANITTNVDTVDAKPITRMGKSAQAVKQGMTISSGLMSVLSGSIKVNHLDLSAFTVGGTDLLAHIKSGTFTGNKTLVEGSAAGTRWKYPNCTEVDFTFNGTLLVPATAGSLLTTAAYGAVSALSVTLSLTINSVITTVPMMLTSLDHQFSEGQVQQFAFTLAGQSPDSGTYPTAPTGSASMLAKAFTAHNTAFAMVFTSHATEGTAYSDINAILESFSFGINDGELVTTEYTFQSAGAPTVAAN